MQRTGKERDGKEDREGYRGGLGLTEREKYFRVYGKEKLVAMLPHEAITSLVYESCLLVQDVEILNLVLERLQPTFTYL